MNKTSNSAVWKDFTITRLDNGSIMIEGGVFKNTKEALKSIAIDANIAIEDNWNTRYLGQFLIQELLKYKEAHMQSTDNTIEKAKQTSNIDGEMDADDYFKFFNNLAVDYCKVCGTDKIHFNKHIDLYTYDDNDDVIRPSLELKVIPEDRCYLITEEIDENGEKVNWDSQWAPTYEDFNNGALQSIAEIMKSAIEEVKTSGNQVSGKCPSLSGDEYKEMIKNLIQSFTDDERNSVYLQWGLEGIEESGGYCDFDGDIDSFFEKIDEIPNEEVEGIYMEWNGGYLSTEIIGDNEFKYTISKDE